MKKEKKKENNPRGACSRLGAGALRVDRGHEFDKVLVEPRAGLGVHEARLAVQRKHHTRIRRAKAKTK